MSYHVLCSSQKLPTTNEQQPLPPMPFMPWHCRDTVELILWPLLERGAATPRRLRKHLLHNAQFSERPNN